MTSHVALVVADTMRIVVGFYGPDGNPVNVPSGQRVRFVFLPESLAVSFAVVGEPLMLDVTPTSSAGTPGQLGVSLFLPPDTTTLESYCCFAILVHATPP